MEKYHSTIPLSNMFSHKEHKEHKESGGHPQTPNSSTPSLLHAPSPIPRSLFVFYVFFVAKNIPIHSTRSTKSQPPTPYIN